MKYRVIWHPGAIREMRGAKRWYQKEAPHVIPRFQDELDRAVEWIATMPNACPPGDLGTRLVILRIFPYVLHFRVVDQAVEVLAVAHAHRRPGYWHSRLT